MLPRIEAEERLNRLNDGMVAAGVADKDFAKDTFARLEDAAAIERPRPRKATPAALSFMGIGVSATAKEALSGPLAVAPVGQPGAANG